MKNILLICMMIFSLVLSWGAVIAEEGFYVIAVKKNNYAPVPKTGQTTSYATGDDGQLKKGVTSPNPRFTDNGDGTVKDNLTGLLWLKNANCTIFNKGDIGFQNERSWNSALGAANSLRSGYCGLTDGSSPGDWRLPNIRELQSLIHYGFENPAVPNTAGTGQWTAGDPFVGMQSSAYYWSSTTYISQSDGVWMVHTYDGYVDWRRVKNDDYYVWPVRGGN